MERKIVGIGLLATIGVTVLKTIFFGATSTVTYVSSFWRAESLFTGLILITFVIYAAVLLLKKSK